MRRAGPPVVTVVIPTFNHAHYVSSAIESVLGQTFRDFEVVVVDDGSTDGTEHVVARYGTSVAYVYQSNQGLAAARNSGIREAQGEYVGFLDADDMYEPDFMATLVSLLEARPDASAAYCGYRFVDSRGGELPRSESRVVGGAEFHQAMLNGNFLVPETVLLRRRCFEQVGIFDERLTACEDWDMWLRLSPSRTFVGTDRVLARHRVSPGSMSTDPHRMFGNRMQVLEKYFSNPDSGKLDVNESRSRAYGRAYLASCVEFLQAGEVETAFERLCRMAETCPKLMTEIETFYELACSDQSSGYRGDFSSLDLSSSGLFLMQFLERFFLEADDEFRSAPTKRSIEARAYQALGLLSYGARRFAEARFFLVRGFRRDPRAATNLRFLLPLAKSLLGVRAVEWLSSWRSRPSALEGT